MPGPVASVGQAAGHGVHERCDNFVGVGQCVDLATHRGERVGERIGRQPFAESEDADLDALFWISRGEDALQAGRLIETGSSWLTPSVKSRISLGMAAWKCACWYLYAARMVS